jgi:hypothetical protein
MWSASLWRDVDRYEFCQEFRELEIAGPPAKGKKRMDPSECSQLQSWRKDQTFDHPQLRPLNNPEFDQDVHGKIDGLE